MENMLALLPLLLLVGATVYGVNRTKANDPTPANQVDAAEMKGKLRVMYDSYALTTANDQGDIIEMCDELPVGARVIDVIVISPVLGAACEFALGDYADADRYIDAVDFGSSGLVARMGDTPVVNDDGFGYEILETNTGKVVGSGTDRQLTLTLSAADVVTPGTIKVIVIYSVE